mgnify:FL=1
MSKVRLVSKSREDLLKLLLKDNRISSIVLLNNEIPESIVINDDGSVTFGRTPKHWWNKIFRDYTTLSFTDLCFKMLNAFSRYLPKDSNLPRILTEEIITNAINKQQYDFVIDRFVMYAFLGVTEGDYKLSILQLIDENPQQQQKNDCGRKKRFRGEGIAYLDLGGGQIPIGVRLEED